MQTTNMAVGVVYGFLLVFIANPSCTWQRYWNVVLPATSVIGHVFIGLGRCNEVMHDCGPCLGIGWCWDAYAFGVAVSWLDNAARTCLPIAPALVGVAVIAAIWFALVLLGETARCICFKLPSAIAAEWPESLARTHRDEKPDRTVVSFHRISPKSADDRGRQIELWLGPQPKSDAVTTLPISLLPLPTLSLTPDSSPDQHSDLPEFHLIEDRQL
jgi:hypothetical protein